ncbi:MAG TPA: VOC family protein [Gaiellaceae bacterium]|nr:VOC family protein [Gaiellaceae bacterium]
MKPRTLDHVALWVEDRGAMAEAAARIGLRSIERTDRFTLLGADARRGKLTLFDAPGSDGAARRERGPLERIGLRVSALDGRDPIVDLGEGLELVLVEADTESELDLDHVALVSADPAAAARQWQALGFSAEEDGRLMVGGAWLELRQGDPGSADRSLLNHLGVLVDSVAEQQAEVEALGVEIADFVDAPNTLALFVRGPDGVKLEYIEHKPSFSLT